MESVVGEIPGPTHEEPVDSRSDYDMVRDIFRSQAGPVHADAVRNETYQRRRAEHMARIEPLDETIAKHNAETERLQAYVYESLRQEAEEVEAVDDDEDW